MTLGLYESKRRRRNRVRWAMVKWTIGLSAILAAGLVAYRSGNMLAQREVYRLRQEITTLDDTLDRRQKENAQLEGGIVAAKKALGDLRQRYERDVPAGEPARLLGLIMARLDQGLDADRLAFLIESAETTRDCDNDPEVRRFIASTPISNGGRNATVSFGKGAIAVSARGVSATNADGAVEAWFDPGEPLTVRFQRIDGKETQVSGTLPLQQSIVLGDREFRFALVPGNRGFVEVAADICRYP